MNVGVEKQEEIKEVVSFDGLKINIADKRLIQVDHITYTTYLERVNSISI